MMSKIQIRQNEKDPTRKSGEKVCGHWIRFRLGFVYILFVLFSSLIVFRLIQLQVAHNPELEALALRQFQKVGTVAPPRLPIFDRNREELAVSMPAGSVFVRPRLVRDKKKVARIFAKVLGGTPAHWARRVESPKPFVWIHRQLSEESAKQLSHYRLPGVFIESENKRVYPNGPLGAHVLGFTDIDGNGIAGTELALNDELLQREQKTSVPRDGRGNPTYFDSKSIRAEDGKTGVYLTIDRRLQHLMEEELERALEETGGKSVLAVVMDPFTGEIFAMGQRPTFDPNVPSQSPPALLNNSILSHLYEPGSTMKVLLAAEAIQQGILTPQSPIDCGDGYRMYADKRVNEAESGHRFGVIPLEKVIAFSSNIGATRIADRLGVQRVRAAIDRFGLTSKTGIRLPGEATASQKNEGVWRPIFLGTVGFGQGIAVTPLQMVSAFAAFANGGYLVRPRILMRENAVSEDLEARRVLSPATALAVREMLVSVTETKGGTGYLARVPNVRVAGKTGTAQKYQAGTGYESRKYFSSFIGFLPADQPELLIGIMVDEPKWPYYAAQVAAPLFKRIAERSLQILDRVPKAMVVSSERVIPTTDTVLQAKRNSVSVVPSDDGHWLMPDLTGLGVREALGILSPKFSNLSVYGFGYLKSQTPAPGTRVTSQSAIRLDFSAGG